MTQYSVVTVYREFFGEAISSPREVSTGFISLHAKPKLMCFALGFYEALLLLYTIPKNQYKIKQQEQVTKKFSK